LSAAAGSPPKELDRSEAVRTPLFLAWIGVVSNRQARAGCQGRCWEKAAYLLEQAWRHRHKPPASEPFALLPAAVAMDRYLPEQVVGLALQSNPEQIRDAPEGGTARLGALSVAASMEHYSQARGHALILQLLEAAKKNPGGAAAAAGPGGAGRRGARGRTKRSPLMRAAASGKAWTAGVRDLLEADPDALRVPDPESELSAALLAASAVPAEEERGDNYDPSLLRSSPAGASTSLFLRRHLDPFGFLTAKHHDRIMGASGLDARGSDNRGASGEHGGADHSSAEDAVPSKPKLKTDGISTVYELVRADPAAALFLNRA
jgi:hypothetical protein